MTTDCLFCKIVAGEIPATVVHETDLTLAFRDINPKAPTHVVVIPKAHHTDAAALAEADPALAGAVLAAAGAVARSEGVDRVRVPAGLQHRRRARARRCSTCTATCSAGRPISWPPG